MIKYSSRLKKQEEEKALKQTFLFSGLTILLIIVFVLFGFPLLIRISVFLGDWRSKTPIAEEEKKDTLAPLVPRLNSLPEATKDNKIKVAGSGEAKSKVIIILNGAKAEEIEADETGRFTSGNLALTKGENEIKAYAVDETENKSDLSKPIFIILDNEAPTLEISQPQEGQVFYGSSKEIEVKGVTEKGAKVYINESLTIVDLSGEFQKIISLNEGENKIKIKAVDKAANSTETELNVSYYR